MSWSAHLRCPCCESSACEVNYTHNTNPMIRLAMEKAGIPVPSPWWESLKNLTGEEAVVWLSEVLHEMEANQTAMVGLTPDNGFGSWAELKAVLSIMLMRSRVYPRHVWWVSG